VAAGSDFDGTLPAGDPGRQKGIIKAFPEGVVGGQFDFDLQKPVSVRSVELKLGGQTSWTLHKKDLDGDELLIICGCDESSYITTESDSFVMTDGQTLILRTVGATSRLKARVSVQAY